jgi:hypothetical protein
MGKRCNVMRERTVQEPFRQFINGTNAKNPLRTFQLKPQRLCFSVGRIFFSSYDHAVISQNLMSK